jgi:hypothetical protein
MRVIRVANKIPNPREIPIGINNCAVVDCSNSSGNKPKKVVSDVNMTGRNRFIATPLTTSAIFEPGTNL